MQSSSTIKLNYEVLYQCKLLLSMHFNAVHSLHLQAERAFIHTMLRQCSQSVGKTNYAYLTVTFEALASIVKENETTALLVLRFDWGAGFVEVNEFLVENLRKYLDLRSAVCSI